MIKRLFNIFFASLFLTLVIIQLIRFFTLSQDISNVNYYDTFFSKDKTTYFLSSRKIVELIQFAPSFSLLDFKELILNIVSLFKSIDSFLDVVYIALFSPLILTLPLLLVIDAIINILIYIIQVLFYVTSYSNTFEVDYINITHSVSTFLSELLAMV